MAEMGTVVGRFEIIRELGRGGMAVVYLARQTELDRGSFAFCFGSLGGTYGP